MTWIDLQEPLPRERPERYEPLLWPEGDVSQLPIPSFMPAASFWEAVDNRRTTRRFGNIGIPDLARFFWYSARIQESLGSSFGFPQTRRPVASAGAIHPIHVLVKHPVSQSWCRYDPNAHATVSLLALAEALTDVEERVSRVVEIENATILLYLAEPGMTAAKYQNESSLVWRDAGALLGHSAMIAAGMGLAFCPLGIMGQGWAEKLNQQGQLAGVGVALLGSIA